MSLKPNEFVEKIVSFEQQKENEITKFKEEKNKELELYEQQLKKIYDEKIKNLKDLLEKKFVNELKDYNLKIEKDFQQKIDIFVSKIRSIEKNFDGIVEKIKKYILNFYGNR
ncbi:MAG: hypothetical protein ACK4WJ_02630 [Endomicrobiia bacterium]